MTLALYAPLIALDDLALYLRAPDTALRVVAPATSDVRDMRPPIARVQSATLAGRTSHPL